MRLAHSLPLLLLVGSVVAADVPKAVPEEWRAAFEANPAMLEPGVYAVERPQTALVVTGRFVPPEPPADARARQLARDRAEVAAHAVLYAHLFDRDKAGLVVPDRLKRFAGEAVLRDAHRRTVEVRGATALATWTDSKGVCCALLVAEGGVRAATEFAPAFRAAAGSHHMKAFEANPKAESVRAAFECDPDSAAVRKAYSAHLVRRRCRVAGFLVASPAAKLPPANDPLAAFLRGTSEAEYANAVAAFERPKPDLEAALDGFLVALDGQYANPDCLNYAGVCLRLLGYHESARVYLAHAAVAPHRLATTNLGLTLLDLDRREEAAAALKVAVKHFPDEPWTEKAKDGLRRANEPAFKDVDIEPPFADWLTARPALMETAGVKVFKLGAGKVGVLAVAAVPLKDGSAKDVLRAERVGREKAVRDLAAKDVGLTIASVQVLKETTTVEVEGGKATSKALAEYLEWTQAKVEGEVTDMPVVGRWRSKDGTVLYLAVGKQITR